MSFIRVKHYSDDEDDDGIPDDALIAIDEVIAVRQCYTGNAADRRLEVIFRNDHRMEIEGTIDDLLNAIMLGGRLGDEDG